MHLHSGSNGYEYGINTPSMRGDPECQLPRSNGPESPMGGVARDRLVADSLRSPLILDGRHKVKPADASPTPQGQDQDLKAAFRLSHDRHSRTVS